LAAKKKLSIIIEMPTGSAFDRLFAMLVVISFPSIIDGLAVL
jgi:hypothetical protein|tara:strand:+ start:565 stop:690 length:126 start_codon:yes stop_codon:yes gene_type:complete